MIEQVLMTWREFESGPQGWSVSLFVFIFGLLVGSFLNVVIYRVPLGRSVSLPPSACVTCNTPLKWWMNIPVFSYVFQSGACGHCGSPFSSRYAMVECFTGLVFLAAQKHFGAFSLDFLKFALLLGFGIVVFFIDLDHWIIPDGVNLLGTLVGFVLSIALPFSDVPEILGSLPLRLGSLLWSIAGSLLGLAFFWSIQVVGLVLVKQEAMGGGDVKFASLVGAFLGPIVAFWSFLAAFFLGAIFALPLLLFRRGGGKDPIPFGTFMAVSALAFAYFGIDRFVFLLDSWTGRFLLLEG